MFCSWTLSGTTWSLIARSDSFVCPSFQNDALTRLSDAMVTFFGSGSSAYSWASHTRIHECARLAHA